MIFNSINHLKIVLTKFLCRRESNYQKYRREANDSGHFRNSRKPRVGEGYKKMGW